MASEQVNRQAEQGGSPDQPGAESPSVGSHGCSFKPMAALDITLAASQLENASESQAVRLVEILDGYLAGLQVGQPPDRQALLAEHPQLAEQLQACLAGLEFIHSAHSHSTATPPRLGDFRILREIGQGGMGAVYEAQQISLRRTVALKVLRFGGVSDPQAVERFQREAETVAQLHHTHIVPIYAVGSERGVSYYAMQLIDGQSLDQVLRERRQAGELLPAETVAQWGLQAAEALAHAHARGVIHRDVKPSNLMLDRHEGRIWLTDFGLAKRLDDVTLSLTGVLLGTPRYMSPEQAAATHHRVDHRTDVYSLGATLYELVTGQPVFRGESPQGVLSQIISTEPTAPRTLCPTLPRDLDTILLKCLAKEPERRYTTAQQLADDLRAVVEGRPIAARRVSVWERAGRWLHRQRRSVALTGGAVAATLSLVILGVLASAGWYQSQLASVMLKTDQPPLVAELLQAGERHLPPITLPTAQRLQVPAGEYQLRVLGNGQLSQTWGIDLEPGGSVDWKVNLSDQQMGQPLTLEHPYRLVQVVEGSQSGNGSGPPAAGQGGAARSGIVELTDDGLRYWQGGSWSSLWELNLREPQQPLLKDAARLIWPWNRLGIETPPGLGVYDARPWIVSQESQNASFDVDGDGTSDLLFAAQQQAWLMALSGRDGQPLWVLSRGEDHLPPADPQRPIRSSNCYAPQLVADVDGDGVADALCTLIAQPESHTHPRRWLELISGATGKTIWQRDLPSELFSLAEDESIPYRLRWFTTHGGSSSGGGFISQMHYKVRRSSEIVLSGRHEYLPCAPRIVQQEQIQCVVGRHLLRLDLARGQLWDAAPLDLGCRTICQPRYGDLDGDGQLDLLLTEELPNHKLPAQGTTAYELPRRRLHAWSPAKQSQLWQYDLHASGPDQAAELLPYPAWPLVADMEGDGIHEVIIPDGCTPADAIEPPWGQLAVLEGATGRPRWHRQLFNMDRQLDVFALGPDIDGDGLGEVFVASQWGLDDDLFVDCLAGSDGRSLWRLQQPLQLGDSEQGDLRPADLQWFPAASDGWPQLAVSLRTTAADDVASQVLLVSAGSGQLNHIALGALQAEPGDFDADGVSDLLLREPAPNDPRRRGARLRSVQAFHAEAWRRQLPPQIVAGDLDGDGVDDLLPAVAQGNVAARSGASGARLWKNQLDDRLPNQVITSAAPTPGNWLSSTSQHDLNGDGVADFMLAPTRVVYQSRQPLLTARSGANGTLLWKSDFEAYVLQNIAWLECRDLDGDGTLEVILLAVTDHGQAAATNQAKWRNEVQLWLTVLSGSDGRTQWKRPLCEIQSLTAGQSPFQLQELQLEITFADLDSDGTLDLAIPAQQSPGSTRLCLQALSGATGARLWEVPLPDHGDGLDSFIPTVASDIDGDGQTDIVLQTLDWDNEATGTSPTEVMRIDVLRGVDGHSQWHWQTPAQHAAHRIIQNRERLLHPLRPVLLKRGDGTQWIAISAWHQERYLSVVDESGQLVSQRRLADKNWDRGQRPWAVDADGDGQEELLVPEVDQLALFPAEQLDQPSWEYMVDPMQESLVLGILPASSEKLQPVVLVAANQRVLQGLNPANGHLLWTVRGPGGTQALSDARRMALLKPPTSQSPAYALFQSEQQALVGRSSASHAALPHPIPPSQSTPSQSTPSQSTSSQSKLSQRVAELSPLSQDPRLLRPLPWKPASYATRDLPALVSWSIFYAAMLIALPGGYAIIAIRRRRLGMRAFMLLPVVVALMLASMLLRPSYQSFAAPTEKVIAALVAIPLWISLAVLVGMLLHHRWKQLVVWLAIAVCLIVALASWSLWRDAQSSGSWQLGERYAWEGWYYIILPALYLWCWLMALAVPLSWLGRSIKRLTRASPAKA